MEGGVGGRGRGIKDVISMTEEEWLEEAVKHGYSSDSDSETDSDSESETESDSESQTDSDSEESGSEESAADEEGENLGPN